MSCFLLNKIKKSLCTVYHACKYKGTQQSPLTLKSSPFTVGWKCTCWIAILFAEAVEQIGENESNYCPEDHFGLYDSCVPSRFIFSLTDLSHCSRKEGCQVHCLLCSWWAFLDIALLIKLMFGIAGLWIKLGQIQWLKTPSLGYVLTVSQKEFTSTISFLMYI